MADGVDSVFIDRELMYVVRGPVLDSFSDYAQTGGHLFSKWKWPQSALCHP